MLRAAAKERLLTMAGLKKPKVAVDGFIFYSRVEYDVECDAERDAAHLVYIDPAGAPAILIYGAQRGSSVRCGVFYDFGPVSQT
jgi:hypothetical protein